MKRFVLFGLLSVAVLWAGNALAQHTDPKLKCEIAYLKSAGQHMKCLFDARTKAARKGGAADYTNCEKQFLAGHLSAAYFGACPTDLWLGNTQRFVPQIVGTDTAIRDNATGLVWEVKTATNSTNKYPWAGTCSVSGSLCQPSQVAVGLCPKGDLGCTLCPQGESCQVAGGGGTAFSWLYDLNAAAFAGHQDWRLPSVGELQTIVAEPYPGSTLPNIDPIFGPTQQDHYWSSTTAALYPDGALNVHFNGGYTNVDDKVIGAYVRAVRGGY